MSILSVDVGTTHCKAGLVEENGKIIGLGKLPMRYLQANSGYAYYDPEELFRTVIEALRIAVNGQKRKSITGIGICSMAESGLLLERKTGIVRTPIIPWFDMSATMYSERIRRTVDPMERFCKTGIRVSAKCSLAKLLWLQDQGIKFDENLVWLSVADYMVYRLTGALRTDYSLAGRTFAFNINQCLWDTLWLKEWDLPGDLFPSAILSSDIAGNLIESIATLLDLPKGDTRNGGGSRPHLWRVRSGYYSARQDI